MKASDLPTKFQTPFGVNAGASFVRPIPQTTADPNAASFDQGFPPITFVPVGGGGVPPDGRDFNGILKESTAWNWWQSAGGAVPYDATFQTAIGGYPAGAIVESTTTVGLYWVSTADDNTTNPDAGGAGWRTLNHIRLNADTTFYVATTGSDSNNGLTVGTPWATIQHACDVIQTAYDLNGFQAIIQLADGTYTAGAAINGAFIGATASTSLLIQGNVVTPANVKISVASAKGFSAIEGAVYAISGMTLTTTGSSGTGNACLYAAYAGKITISAGVVFGASVAHIVTDADGTITCTDNYSVTGGAQAHYLSQFGGSLNVSGVAVTLTGTPAFSSAFALAQLGGNMNVAANTYSGSATGARYSAQTNGVIYTAGSGANYLPGNSAGTTGTGGQYV